MSNHSTSWPDKIREAAEAIGHPLSGSPEIGLILGSGLGELAEEIENPAVMPFGDIPHFPVSTVEGHAGRLVLGTLEGKRVIAMQGRFHYYEGYSMKEVTFPVYVMRQLGIEALIVTNAAGGMNRSFAAGDLMLITDHINMTGNSPLIGPDHPELGVRFPDMSEAYYKPYIQLAERIAADQQIQVRKGIYCGITGPAYLTPAELIMMARIGGDAIGMSTVAEVIAARHAGLRVLGISCITDMAIGEELEPLTHGQVVAVANRTRPKFKKLVRRFIREV